jgi:hypothetical protein
MSSHVHRRPHIRERVRDYVLYIVIGGAFIAVSFAVEDKWGSDAFTRWGGLAGYSAILFWYFIDASRPLLRRRSFWALTAVLLSAHLTGFVIILTRVAQWRHLVHGDCFRVPSVTFLSRPASIFEK